MYIHTQLLSVEEPDLKDDAPHGQSSGMFPKPVFPRRNHCPLKNIIKHNILSHNRANFTSLNEDYENGGLNADPII